MGKSKVEYNVRVNFRSINEEERANKVNRKLTDIIKLEVNSDYYK